MQEFNVAFTDEADIDLENIVYYLSNFSPAIARKYYDEIMLKANSLETMPERCPLIRDELLREKGYRWLFVRNYTIFFTVHKKENIVSVRRILYARQDYTALL